MADKDVPFVIGAGLGRTGTVSLSYALDQIGYKTFHMYELIWGRSDPNPWFDLAEATRAGKPDKVIEELSMRAAKTMIDDGYTATTDFPSILVYSALLKAQPNAKVILSVRKSGKAWSRSVLKTIARNEEIFHNKRPFIYFPFWSGFASHLNPWMFESIGLADFGEIKPDAYLNEEKLSKAHDDWIEHIKANVPKDKLLIHKSAEGFEPICKHLNISPENCPQVYPYINDSFQMGLLLSGLRAINLAFWPCVILVVFLVAFIARRFFRKVLMNKKKVKTI